MTVKTRLSDLSSQLNQLPKTAEPSAPVATTSSVAAEVTPELIANRSHGDKGDHIKITVTLPPEVYRLIANEVTRRKLAKEPNSQLSAIIREALVAHFTKSELNPVSAKTIIAG